MNWPPPPPPPPPPDNRPIWERNNPYAPQKPPRTGMSTVAIVGAVICLILGGLWYSGALDEPLSSIGLNKNPCIKNAFGATFCGDTARSYCENLSGLRELSDSPDACDELGY